MQRAVKPPAEICDHQAQTEQQRKTRRERDCDRPRRGGVVAAQQGCLRQRSPRCDCGTMVDDALHDAEHRVDDRVVNVDRQRRVMDVNCPEQPVGGMRSEEHTSELQPRQYLVCRLLLDKRNTKFNTDEQFTELLCAIRFWEDSQDDKVGEVTAAPARRYIYFFLKDSATPVISPFPIRVVLTF